MLVRHDKTQNRLRTLGLLLGIAELLAYQVLTMMFTLFANGYHPNPWGI